MKFASLKNYLNSMEQQKLYTCEFHIKLIESKISNKNVTTILSNKKKIMKFTNVDVCNIFKGKIRT